VKRLLLLSLLNGCFIFQSDSKAYYKNFECYGNVCCYPYNHEMLICTSAEPINGTGVFYVRIKL
jgi:hypothetical protein